MLELSLTYPQLLDLMFKLIARTRNITPNNNKDLFDLYDQVVQLFYMSTKDNDRGFTTYKIHLETSLLIDLIN